VAVAVAVIVTIVVVVAVGLGARVFAAFVAGASSSAVVAYVAVANRLIYDARRHG
jgi:hypothetical protein